MKQIILIFLYATMMFSQQKPPNTVKYVDLKKYVGLWYEIAKIPNSFQDQCIKGTTAKYALNEDGEISVKNSCIDEDGEIDEAKGVVRIVDKKTNAKLEVSFVSFLGWRPFWGDYWIIGLDENYQWAIVGTPNRKYGWVLSRTPKLENETMDKIFQILKDQGYNKKDFVISPQ
ncbi:MAG: lipocalin family protein [Ignavibacteriales bacterium]|nr:lipocalin family protein [Ignavibacteriales bacterium]